MCSPVLASRSIVHWYRARFGLGTGLRTVSFASRTWTALKMLCLRGSFEVAVWRPEAARQVLQVPDGLMSSFFCLQSCSHSSACACVMLLHEGSAQTSVRVKTSHCRGFHTRGCSAHRPQIDPYKIKVIDLDKVRHAPRPSWLHITTKTLFWSLYGWLWVGNPWKCCTYLHADAVCFRLLELGCAACCMHPGQEMS